VNGKRKPEALLPFITLGLAVGTAIVVASYVFWSHRITITVREPCSVSHDIPETLTLYAGGSQTYVIAVTNRGGADVKVKLDWAEEENPEGVDYDVLVSPSDEVEVSAGETVELTVKIKVKADSPTGTVKLVFTLERKRT